MAAPQMLRAAGINQRQLRLYYSGSFSMRRGIVRKALKPDDFPVNAEGAGKGAGIGAGVGGAAGLSFKGPLHRRFQRTSTLPESS